jgi:hypothetical protein
LFNRELVKPLMLVVSHLIDVQIVVLTDNHAYNGGTITNNCSRIHKLNSHYSRWSNIGIQSMEEKRPV